MPVGPGAGDAEGRSRGRRVAQVAGGGSGFAEPVQSLDEVGRPLGEVGDGAVLDFALPAERCAQEDVGRRVAVGDARDKYSYLTNDNVGKKDLPVKDILNLKENLHGYIRKTKKAINLLRRK